MKTYWFVFDEGVTDSYHSGGGVVVMAQDRDAALAAALQRCPDASKAELVAEGEVVQGVPVVFQDAGCC